MRVVYERYCGVDIHKKSVVACVLITPETREVQRYLRTFSTMTAGLLALADWLDSLQITVKGSEWIADLLRHGLLQASFIPPAPIRELRDLTRYRKTLIQERTQ